MMKRTVPVLALAAAWLWSGATPADGLPDDIWNGKHGGRPSITASRDGVSIVLPGKAVDEAGGGSFTALVQNFLQTHGPKMCSDLFDFNVEHKRLQVQVAIEEQTDPEIPFFEVSRRYGVVVFDYAPGKKVNCVPAQPPTS